MLKVIFRQIIHRLRSNAWLLTELSLVFGVVWYMMDYFFVLGYNLHIPSYADNAHIWQIEVGQLPPTHPEYQPGESDSAKLEANFARVMDRLQNFPGVEAASVSFYGGLVGSGTFYGIRFHHPSDTVRKFYGQLINVDPRYDYFRVFRFSSGGGARPVSLHDYNWADPRTRVICDLGAQQIYAGEEAAGKEIALSSGTDSERYLIGGVVDQTKRFAYQRPRPVVVQALRADATNIQQAEICLRSSEEWSDAVFLEALNEKLAGSLRIGNFYFRAARPLRAIADDTAYFFGFTNDYYVRVGLLLFFLVNISLCVIGSFWYRIRMRRPEIGLRMATGASREAIRNMFFLEGICLLTLAMIPALFVESQVVYAGLLDTLGTTYSIEKKYLPDYAGLRFILTNLLTWLFLCVIVVAAIWLPAGNAAAIAPADALRDE